MTDSPTTGNRTTSTAEDEAIGLEEEDVVGDGARIVGLGNGVS